MFLRTRPMQHITKVIFVVCSLFILLVFIPVAHAHEGEEEDAGHLIPHQLDGLHITGGVTSILQGTSGIANHGDVTDFSYTLDLNFEAPVSKTGKVVIAFEAGNGKGVNDNMPSLSISNYDAYITEVNSGIDTPGVVTPSVSQVYYEGKYFDGFLGVKAGKIDVHACHDDNAYANDETDQFITGMFVRSTGSIFPELDTYYAPGVSLTLSPSEMFDFTVTGANGNGSGFEDVFSHAYTAGQVNVKPKFLGNDGNYRFYYIYDARKYTEIGSGKTANNNGFGLSLDQNISEGIGLFARYSSQDDSIDENLVKSSVSGGVSVSGKMWKRDNDVIGVAYGILNVNDKSSHAAANPGDEGHFEVYYKVGFSDHFTLTPDLQVVTNAGGDAGQDTITLLGVRGQLNF